MIDRNELSHWGDEEHQEMARKLAVADHSIGQSIQPVPAALKDQQEQISRLRELIGILGERIQPAMGKSKELETDSPERVESPHSTLVREINSNTYDIEHLCNTIVDLTHTIEL